MVVSPLDEVIYQKAHDENVFTITLNKNEIEDIRKKIPFWKDADPFIILK